MSTIQTSPSASPKLLGRLTAATIATGVVAMLALATVIVLISSSGHTGAATAATGRSDALYAPLIQYRGTGQRPPTIATARSARWTYPTTGLRRAEHSYGTVP